MDFGEILAIVSLVVMVVAAGITVYFASRHFRCPGVVWYEKITTAASTVAVVAAFVAVIGGALTL